MVEWHLVAMVASGVVLAGLGVAVLLAGPRSRTNQAFALYAVGASATPLSFSLILVGPAAMASAFPFMATLAFAGGVGVALLGTRFPAPLERTDRPRAIRAILFAVALAALHAAWSWVWTSAGIAAGDFADMTGWWSGLVVETIPVSALWGLLALFALRYREDVARRTTYAVMSAALVVPAAFRAGQFLIPVSSFPSPAELALRLAFASLALGGFAWLWLRNLASGGPRWLPALPSIGLGAGLAGLAIGYASAEGWAYSSAVANAAAAAILAFGIARGQVAGLDTKLRWSISRGTIAAFFVAAFFVASEVAQQFFGARTGSVYVGIAASGLLVFAIAPLQRAADRLASAAVPTADRADREEVYRRAVRLAMRGRALTREEERDLVRLAESLGIGASRAMDIRDEIQGERSAPAA